MGRGGPVRRQWELIRVLHSHRFGVATEELAKELGVGVRTVLRDLAVLRDLVPLRHDTRARGKRYWMLDDEALGTCALQPTLTEMLSLCLCQQFLRPLGGTEFGDGLSALVERVRTVVPAGTLAHFESLQESFHVKNVAGHDYSGQSEHIRSLNEAIRDQRVVRIAYWSASEGRQIDSEFHPYGMLFLGTSPYCVGHMACCDALRTLKLARLRDLAVLETTFDKPPHFSLPAQFEGTFGVFHAQAPQRIRVEFTGWAATNVREMQWHPSQRITRGTGDTVEATFDLGSTVEFKRWLLGFGPCARVLAPDSLAREIQGDLALSMEGYGHARSPAA